MTPPAYPSFGILIVDDEPAWLRSMRLSLARIADITNVIPCPDGRDVMGLIQKHDIGLVLLDLTMPHMDGAETFQELRRIRPGVRVILSSGYNEQEVAARFSGKSVAGFIQKPYTLAALTAAFQQVLDTASESV